MRSNAKRMIQDSHERNKQYYDAKRSGLTFQEGDLVLMKNLKRRKGRNVKLQPKFIGPYRVFRKLSDNNYQVVSVGGQPKSDIVHVEKTKALRGKTSGWVYQIDVGLCQP